MALNEHLTTAKNSTMRFFRRLFIGILVIAVIALLLSFLATKVPYSEGERAGVVSKFSRKGYVIKTYEGELNVGAQGQVGNMANNLWAFTVDSNDPNVTKKLEDAMLTGGRLRLHYEQRYLKFFWMGDTDYFVTQVDKAP